MIEVLAVILMLLVAAGLVFAIWVICQVLWAGLTAAIEHVEDQFNRPPGEVNRFWLCVQWLLLRLVWLAAVSAMVLFTIITVLFIANDIKEKILDRE